MKTGGRILLAGGGGAEDSRLLDETLASWIGPEGRLLYIPIALRGIRSFESCLEWITGTFAPLSISRITMWTNLAEHQSSELDEFDAIYIGGGNSFSLMAELISSSLDLHLQAYAQRGGILYGGSAGAVVLGKDIRTVSNMDHNHVGLTRVNCLNVANEYAAWPHYRTSQDPSIAEFVLQHGQPVLGIPERSGVVIEAGEMRSVGFEPSFKFDSNGKSEV